ncbi:MAG: acyltransferase domain-containing protein, partial [Actinomycetota bacterium]|nr:acyltransferase domain-containing protein [Actinomycetota bacterium]
MAIGVTPPDQSTVGASVALVFPGQGTQRESMGAPWRDAASWSLVSAISEQSGHDVEELLLSTEAEVLRRTDLAQIAVFSTCMVALGELRHAGVPATVVACAGHSLGEYAALVAAGALSLADGAALVAARGAAMLEAARRRPGTMAVVAGVG